MINMTEPVVEKLLIRLRQWLSWGMFRFKNGAIPSKETEKRRVNSIRWIRPGSERHSLLAACSMLCTALVVVVVEVEVEVLLIS